MVFLIIFGLGLLLTIVTFAIGEIFDLGDFGDSGGDIGDGSPSPLSSRIVFVFVTAFGGSGFIAQTAGWPMAGAVGMAVAGGLAVAAGTFFLIVLPMAKQQGSVKLELADLVSLEGEVTDEIPQGGLGRVTVVPPGTGSRVARAARSESGAAIRAGTRVRVVHAGPGSLTVAPLEQMSAATQASQS